MLSRVRGFSHMSLWMVLTTATGKVQALMTADMNCGLPESSVNSSRIAVTPRRLSLPMHEHSLLNGPVHRRAVSQQHEQMSLSLYWLVLLSLRQEVTWGTADSTLVPMSPGTRRPFRQSRLHAVVPANITTSVGVGGVVSACD